MALANTLSSSSVDAQTEIKIQNKSPLKTKFSIRNLGQHPNIPGFDLPHLSYPSSSFSSSSLSLSSNSPSSSSSSSSRSLSLSEKSVSKTEATKNGIELNPSNVDNTHLNLTSSYDFNSASTNKIIEVTPHVESKTDVSLSNTLTKSIEEISASTESQIEISKIEEEEYGKNESNFFEFLIF